MIEFKFSCPNCSQHIQCNDAYSGLQIVCPTCKNQIVVPQAPGATAPQPAAAAPVPRSSQPVYSQATAAPKAPVPAPARRKSKPRWGMIGGAALIIAGALVYVFFSGAFSKSEKASEVTATQPTVPKMVPAKKTELAPESVPVANATPAHHESPDASATNSTDSQTPTAAEIVRNVIEQYDSLTNYSATGKTVSLIDMSGVDSSKMAVPSGNDTATSQDEIKKALSKPQRIETDFSIKLGRPGLYRVEWEGQLGAIRNTGATWSSGEGDFVLIDMGQVKYAKLKSRELALTATTGASSGVANTLPQIFFKGRSSLLNSFREATRDADETVEGDDCYVLTGNALGMTVRLWIIKTNFLIKQKQQVLGGHLKIPEMSEAKMEESYKMLGGNSADERKARIEKMRSVASKLKGTMTETYENIKTNQPLTAADFKHEVPAGTMLSDSLF